MAYLPAVLTMMTVGVIVPFIDTLCHDLATFPAQIGLAIALFSVPAAVLALERFGEASDRHSGGKAAGVDLIDRGREQMIDADLGREVRVALSVAGVDGQIGRIVERGGVHEQRHHDHVAPFARSPQGSRVK